MNANAITEHEELYFRLALSNVPGIGSRTGRSLLEKFGNATTIFKVPLKELKNAEGIGEVKAKGFKNEDVLRAAEKELNFILRNDIQTLCITDNYPKRLTGCADAPLLLFCKGNINTEAAKVVAIVGTRKNTDYGHKLCDELIEGLSSLEGLLIVSGLALGIDAIAHKKCVQLGIPTIGVLGHGLDTLYPHTHKALAGQMMENGGLLTEFPSDTVVDRTNFPMRNRIVAGLSDVTVVVESNISGGALITASLAAGYHRDVAAFPGRVNDSRSAGCNELIRTNVATMITKADDLVELMNWDKDKKTRAVQTKLFLNLTTDEQKIVDLLQTRDNIHADELFHHCGLPNSMLAATLLQLEMQGLIKALPGKFYRMY